MSEFITFNSTGEHAYLFKGPHMFLLFSCLILVIFFTLYFERQSKKAQHIFVGIATFLLILLEVSRIVWRYFYLKNLGEELSFINVTGLDFFTLALWISVFFLIFGVIFMGKFRYVFGLSFVFAVGGLASLITIIYPAGINTLFPFYHCYNVIYLLQHSLLGMLGCILAISSWISASQFLDLWRALISLVFFGLVCIALNIFFGWENNLFYVVSCPIFESIGMYLPFPIHYLLLGAFLFVFQIFLYLPFRWFESWRNKQIERGIYHRKR